MWQGQFNNIKHVSLYNMMFKYCSIINPSSVALIFDGIVQQAV